MAEEAGTRRMPTMAALEQERRRVIAEVQRLEAVLGRTRHPGKRVSVFGNMRRRSRVKEEMNKHRERLRLLNAAIKAGRRSGELMMLNGVARPKDERQLIAALYRMFVDCVGTDDLTPEQDALLKLTRDVMLTGDWG